MSRSAISASSEARAFVAIASSLLVACGASEGGDPTAPPALDVTPIVEPPTSAAPESVAPAPPPAPKPKPPLDPLTLRPAYTEHLGRFTTTTKNPPPTGMLGTDLGASFVRDGKVVFLFGDTLASDASLADVDFTATSDVVFPATGLPKLTWGGGLTVPGLSLGSMNVPVEGVANGDDTYVFFATKFSFPSGDYGGSAIAKTKGLAFDQLALVEEVAAGDFANVSVVVENDEAFVFGTGAHYRGSAVALARVPLAQIADRSAWKIEPSPVVDVDCAGELSVRKHPTLALYVMAYNCGEPRGVWLHLAKSPAGPWIAAGNMLEAADAYESFIHADEDVTGYDDGLAPGDEDTWGGEYAPYFVPSWFVQDGDAFGLVYLLSSWNPYQTHVMRTWLVPPDVTLAPPVRGANLPKPTILNGDFALPSFAGWTMTGDAASFSVSVGSDGKRRMSTSSSAKGDAAVGTLSQTFMVDAKTSSLSFAMYGGDVHVVLRHGDEIVRESRARRTPASTETEVKWNLVPYRGETVTLEIDDDQTGAWGWVGVRDFVLQ